MITATTISQSDRLTLDRILQMNAIYSSYMSKQSSIQLLDFMVDTMDASNSEHIFSLIFDYFNIGYNAQDTRIQIMKLIDFAVKNEHWRGAQTLLDVAGVPTIGSSQESLSIKQRLTIYQLTFKNRGNEL